MSLGTQLFDEKKYDEALVALQDDFNSSDLVTRNNGWLYIGRCLYETGRYAQAAQELRDATEQYGFPEDDLGKELYYWMGRSFESDNRNDDAMRTYGQLAEWDYNYRSVELVNRLKNLYSQWRVR